MQTPISFILDLILDHDLPEKAQKACRKYVREYEKGSEPIHRNGYSRQVLNTSNAAQQAPSTQRLLDQHASIPASAIIPTPVVPVAARIVGGEVNTGGGTKGPRKF